MKVHCTVLASTHPTPLIDDPAHHGIVVGLLHLNNKKEIQQRMTASTCMTTHVQYNCTLIYKYVQ